jgi:hypothetical protein
MTFSEKLIEVTFNLAEGHFDGGGNTATVSGLRISAVIEENGGPDQSFANLSIYGLPMSLMNQLTNVGAKYNFVLLNGMTILAGDASGMNLVFEGQIHQAFMSGQGIPDAFLHVSARPGYYSQMKPVLPLSVKGSGDVATMMSSLAKQMGFAFENSGVTARLANPYYWGTAWQQAAMIARDAGIDWSIDRGTLVIMDPSKPREGDVPLISRDTGMVGYPTFDQALVIVTALYNPAVKRGGAIEIQSDMTAANGKFTVNNVVYELESQTPGGRWFMTITARVFGETTP